jgi:aspartokinase/homoserine dehydrogenase 1
VSLCVPLPPPRYPSSHPFAQLSGSDNLVVFTTRRYGFTPLSVRGPGAGAQVTAAGVFGDMLAILRSAGVPT